MRGKTVAFVVSLALLACQKQESPAPAAKDPAAPAAAPATPTPAPPAAPTPPPPAASGTDWVHPEKLMSIHFPGKPNEQQQDAQTPIGPVKVTMAMQAEDTAAYMATATLYKVPDGQTGSFDVDKALDGGRDGMLGNVHGKATGEKPIELDGYKGREVTFEAPGPNGQTIRGTARIFAGATPPSAYMASAFRMTDATDPKAAPFLDSMHIGKGVK